MAESAGVGRDVSSPRSIPIVTSLLPEADRLNVFARRNQVLNATLAASSLAAHLADRKPFPVGSEIWPSINGATRR